MHAHSYNGTSYTRSSGATSKFQTWDNECAPKRQLSVQNDLLEWMEIETALSNFDIKFC